MSSRAMESASGFLGNLSVTQHLRVEAKRTIYFPVFISVRGKWLARKLNEVGNKTCLSVTEHQ